MKKFQNVYITQTASHLPGEPVDNTQMDAYIAPINRFSTRIKQKILKENGIQTRHYAINTQGQSYTSVRKMAAAALQSLTQGQEPIDFLALASTGADAAAPGLANFVQSELHLPPLETLSINGICAASMGALNSAAEHVDKTKHPACAGASEFPSRLFKSQRFTDRSEISFDAHFLRWMLSDGAGAVRLESQPKGRSLKLQWIHNKSFSADYPTCMQVGLDEHGKGYLDYDSLGAAQAAGAFDLKQDIRILNSLFDVGISEYASLVHQGHIEPQNIKAFLCHYSSEKFKGIIKDLMEKAGLLIEQTHWFSNLKTKGNTGSASIYIMLDEFWNTKLADLKYQDKILLFVPESGKFTISFAQLEVVDAHLVSQDDQRELGKTYRCNIQSDPLQDPTVQDFFSQQRQAEQQIFSSAVSTQTQNAQVLEQTLRGLIEVWQNYRSQVLRGKIAKSVFAGTFGKEQYLQWMSHWIPQVREGSVWMHKALSAMEHKWRPMAQNVRTHISEEQFDWQILWDDYRKNGGTKDLSSMHLTPGAAALNAYMHAQASTLNAWHLLGAIYIIEGTGEKIIPLLLPKMDRTIVHSRFLTYHGENDVHHLEHWLFMLQSVLCEDPDYGPKIVQCAQDCASLYYLHWEHAL